MRCSGCNQDVESFVRGKRCRSCYNAYMNSYMSSKYKRLRETWIDKFGGKCIKCGSLDGLQFDHIEANSKVGSVARFWSRSGDAISEELAKCQLLCHGCHKAKTTKEYPYNDTLRKSRTCNCGKQFHNVRSYAGHRTWCKT